MSNEEIWNSDNISVSGLNGQDIQFDDLYWKDNTLYLNYSGTPGDGGGGSSVTPSLLIATWTNESTDGLWNGTSLNWEQEGVDYAYVDGVQVVFGDEGAGTVTLVGDIAPSSVLVDSAEDYTWNADATVGGRLTEGMALTKKGEGKLTINSENDYTGGTSILRGTVVAGSATALGDGAVNLTNATLEIAAEGVSNALTTAGTSSILVQDGGSLTLNAVISNAAAGVLTLSGKVDVSGIGELTKLDATLIDVNGNAGECGFARAEGYTLQVVNGGKVLGSGAELVHSDLPTGLTLVLGENGLATAGAATDFTKYVVADSHAVSVSEILKDVPADSTLSCIKMSGGTLLVDAATDALSATAGTVTVTRDVVLGGTMSGGMLLAQAGGISATLSGSTSVVANGTVTLSGNNSHRGGVMLNGGSLTLQHANALGSGQLVTCGISSLVIDSGVELALGQAISNSGTLSISGNIQAKGNLNTVAATRVDVNGNSGTSGFAKDALEWVQIVNGGTTVNAGAAISHASATGTLVLGSDGLATCGGEVHHDTYLLTGTGVADVQAIKDAAGSELTEIHMTGGTLTVGTYTEGLLNAKDGVIMLGSGGVIGSGSSVNGVDIKASGGSIAATLTGNNTLEGIGNFALDAVIANNGTLVLSGSIKTDALDLVTESPATLIDVDGASGTSGFARSALMSVQLTSGTGSTIDGGVTISHKDANGTLVLGTDGKASYGGTVDYTHYLLNGINDKASVSGIIADAGDALNGITVQAGTLTVDAVTKPVTATGGAVVLAGGVLNGSLEDTALTLKNGSLGTVSITGGSVMGVDYLLGGVLQLSGNVSISGSYDASALTLETEAATRIDVSNTSGESGFLQAASYAVQVFNGGVLTVADGTTVTHGSHNLVLGSDGVATAGGGITWSEYLLTGDDTATASAIYDKALAAGYNGAVAITQTGGTLNVTDNAAVCTTAGNIILTNGTLSGTISGATLSVSGGMLTAALSGTNTLSGTNKLFNVLDNDGTLNISGLLDVTQLGNLTDHGVTYTKGGSNGFKTSSAYSIRLVENGGTLNSTATIKHGEIDNFVLGSDGVATAAGTTDYRTYFITAGHEATVDAIRGESGNQLTLVDMSGGSLNANADAAVKVTGGAINLTAGTLSGSISGAALSITGGSLTATLSGTNTLSGANKLLNVLDNEGILNIRGSLDVTQLGGLTDHGVTYTKGGSNGFKTSSAYSIRLVDNVGTLNSTATIMHGEIDNFVLGSDGVATAAGTTDYKTYFITAGHEATVDAIRGESGNQLTLIDMSGGTLNANADAAVKVTGGAINLTAGELSGSISGATLSITGGSLTAALSGTNTLSGTNKLFNVLDNDGTLNISGLLDVTQLGNLTDHGVTYTKGGSNGFKTSSAYSIRLVDNVGTLNSTATIMHGEIDNFVLGSDGVATAAGTTDYKTYFITAGHEATVDAIRGESGNQLTLIDMSGGTLNANADAAVKVTGGAINLTAGELSGSISGSTINASAGTLVAALAGNNTLVGHNFALDGVLTNSGTLTLSGTFTIGTGLTVQHAEAGYESLSGEYDTTNGFARTEWYSVDIADGVTADANATITYDGKTLKLGNDGVATRGGEVDYTMYYLNSGELSTKSLHDHVAGADITLKGGTLTVETQSTVTATGGAIKLVENGVLNGSLTNTNLTLTKGTLNAELKGGNAIIGAGYVLSEMIQNGGSLTVQGSFDASGLQLTTKDSSRVDVVSGNSGNSGFLKQGDSYVKIINGGTLTIDGAVVTHEDAAGALVLGTDGYARSAGGTNYGEYLLVGNDTVNVAAILGADSNATIKMQGGTLNVDVATDALTATAGIINLNTDVVLGGSISGATINASKGTLSAALSGNNTLVGTGYALNSKLNNAGTLSLSGSFTIGSGLEVQHTAAGYESLNGGYDATNGFARTEWYAVDIADGVTADANATITYDGKTLKLGTDGVATRGGEVDYTMYYLNSGELSTKTIHDRVTGADITLRGGTLMVETQSTVTATGGAIKLVENGVLNGSLTNTNLTLTKGTLNAELKGGNAIIGAGYVLSEMIQNGGSLTVQGSFDASGLQLTTKDSSRVDVVSGNSGNSGFLKQGDSYVKIINGGTLTIDGAVVTHEDAAGALVLGTDGYARSAGGTNYGEYLLVGNDTVNVAAILGADSNATIKMQGGTLNVDVATDALTATAGIINLNTDVVLGGSISGATINASKGTLSAALSGNNTLVGTGYALNSKLNNTGTLSLSGTFTVNSLTTDEAATYVGLEGCSTSGFAKEAYKVATIATGATADAGATITYNGEVLKLNTNGTASKGGTVDYSTFWLKSDVTVASNAIHTQSANALVNITAGKLMVKDETRVQANGGSVELVTGGVLNGSLSGTELTLKAGTVNASIADGSIIGSDYALSEVLQVSGNVSISGSFVADALTLTTIDTKRVDVVEGNSGNSGFLKHGDSYVQIISGDTLDIADGTIVKHGSIDLTLGADGYARSAGGTEWGEYLLTGSDKVSTNMIHTGEGAGALVRQEGGLLTVNDATTVSTTSGTIILSGATLSGSVTDARVTAETGCIAATLHGITAVTVTDNVSMSGDNNHSGGTTLAGARLTITHANALGSGSISSAGQSSMIIGDGVTLVLGNSIANSGELTLKGSIDASELNLELTEAGRLSLNGNQVSLSESGFARAAEYSVLLVAGGKTVNAGVSILHDDYRMRSELVLGEDGVARAGGGVDYSRFYLTGEDAVSVSAVDAVSESKGSDLLNVTMDGGALEVDADITVEASGGSIVITDDSSLRGAIANADITAAAGDYASDIAADISGGSKVTVNGGAVTLSGENSYTGGTIVNAGTLVAGSDMAFGTGEVELRGGVMELNQRPLENKLLAQGGIISGGSGFRGAVVVNGSVGLRGNLSASSLTLNGGSELSLNGSSISVSGVLTLGGSAVLKLNGSDFGDGDVLITFGSLSGSEEQLTVKYGADSDKYGVEKKGNALILAWLEETQPEEEEKPSPLPPTEPDIPEQPVPTIGSESCDALVQSSWGVFTASHAFADAIGGQRSAAGYVGRPESVVWVSALGGMHRIDGTGSCSGSDIDLFGAAVGLEHYMSATDAVGFAVGRLSGDVKLNNSGRETEQEGTYIGVYGTHQLAEFARTDSLNLKWSAVYGDTETEGSIGQEEMSRTQDSVQLNARLSWTSLLSDAWVLNLFAGMEYFASDSAENEESEEARIRMGSIQNLRGELGIGTRYTSGSTTLYGELRYLNDVVRSNPYADINGVRGYGANPGRQGIGVTVGAQQELGGGWSVSASYSLEAMSEATMHSANVGVGLRF